MKCDVLITHSNVHFPWKVPIFRDRAQISSFTQKRACPFGGRGFEPCPYFLLKKLKIFFYALWGSFTVGGMFQGLQKRRNFESFMALSVDGKIYFRGNKHDSAPSLWLYLIVQMCVSRSTKSKLATKWAVAEGECEERRVQWYRPQPHNVEHSY